MDKQIKIIWWGILGLLLVLAGLKTLLPVNSPVEVEVKAANKEIVIYITGAVQKPGLYHLPLDARMEDVLKEAVLLSEADQEALNPAQKLKDGQKIIIPYLEQYASAIDASRSDLSAQEYKSAVTKGTVGSNKVNINRAGLEELDTLPGIGPVLAQRILDYRAEYGFFSSAEEIQNVSGIGAKTYEKMLPYLSVGP